MSQNHLILALMEDKITPEIFHSIQGEGSVAGINSVFIRLGLCNLACSWCDTPYTWDFKKYKKSDSVAPFSFEDIFNRLDNMLRQSNLLVFTGGEPLIQHNRINDFFEQHILDCPVMFETNGTIDPFKLNNSERFIFSVSPKLASSGNINRKVFYQSFLKLNTNFKFVVTGEEDLQQIIRIVEENNIPRNRVWLMPEGQTTDKIDSICFFVAESCITYGFNFSDRLHVRLFGNKRGV